ncbi:MAG: hypothetical protein LBJ12_01870 [Oscillospiraceae bacterium]|jgi:hypothetical protein|nr:hypothetical protein [Oscillospiraceae bacterium]
MIKQTDFGVCVIVERPVFLAFLLASQSTFFHGKEQPLRGEPYCKETAPSVTVGGIV